MFLALYVDLFNPIFKSGKIPNTWLADNIVPFYKNKGTKTYPKKLSTYYHFELFWKIIYIGVI
jgi:hypothetical protein